MTCSAACVAIAEHIAGHQFRDKRDRENRLFRWASQWCEADAAIIRAESASKQEGATAEDIDKLTMQAQMQMSTLPTGLRAAAVCHDRRENFATALSKAADASATERVITTEVTKRLDILQRLVILCCLFCVSSSVSLCLLRVSPLPAWLLMPTRIVLTSETSLPIGVSTLC
jgi:hypothetical protein